MSCEDCYHEDASHTPTARLPWRHPALGQFLVVAKNLLLAVTTVLAVTMSYLYRATEQERIRREDAIRDFLMSKGPRGKHIWQLADPATVTVIGVKGIRLGVVVLDGDPEAEAPPKSESGAI